jgi:hypothetical protein
MKKILLSVFVVIFTFVLSGCNKTNDEWELTKDTARGSMELMIEEDVINVFNDANKKYTKGDLDLVALLGEQVVAGTNYMFLCRSDDSYKVVIVYNDLSGNSEITSVKDFDLNKYAYKDNSVTEEMLSGGWHTSIPGKTVMLSEKVQSYFDTAFEQIIGVSYYPIMTLATKGNDYLILAYGRMSDLNATEGVYVVTLKVDEQDKPTVNIAGIDLKDFNN